MAFMFIFTSVHYIDRNFWELLVLFLLIILLYIPVGVEFLLGLIRKHIKCKVVNVISCFLSYLLMQFSFVFYFIFYIFFISSKN